MMGEVIADSLAEANGGAISNGPTLPRPKAPRRHDGRTVASPVVVSLQPWWVCDGTTCPKGEREGVGGDSMLEHAARYHGRRGLFSDRRWL